MGKDKTKDKLGKKRIKAEAKAKKKRLKAELETESGPTGSTDALEGEPKTKSSPEPKMGSEKVPWYKNPDWIRAIIAIASLIVAIIILMLNIYK